MSCNCADSAKGTAETVLLRSEQDWERKKAELVSFVASIREDIDNSINLHLARAKALLENPGAIPSTRTAGFLAAVRNSSAELEEYALKSRGAIESASLSAEVVVFVGRFGYPGIRAAQAAQEVEAAEEALRRAARILPLEEALPARPKLEGVSPVLEVHHPPS
jgi:hypothetical protein